MAWESAIDRYRHDMENGFYARKVDKSSFEEVADNLAENVQIVLESGKASVLEVYSRGGKLFDSGTNHPKEVEGVVNHELQGFNLPEKNISD